MKNIFLIVLVIISTSCATKKHLKTGGDWSGYNYSFFYPKYTFSERAKLNPKFSISEENNISLINKDFNIIQDKAKKIIIDSCGLDIFSKIKFYDIDVTYWDSILNFNSVKQNINETKCTNTKFYIRYLLHYKKMKVYCFGLAFDNNYNLISPLDLPRQIETFKIINPKTALVKARLLTFSLFRKRNKIELIFNAINNRFDYKWTGEYIFNKKLKKSVTLNATTGKMLDKKFYSKHFTCPPF